MVISILLLLAGAFFVGFLLAKSLVKSGFFLIAAISCFGVILQVLQGYYLGYLMVFLGVVSVVVGITFNMVTLKEDHYSDRKNYKKIPVIFSGSFIFCIFVVLASIIRKNQQIVHKSNFQRMSDEKVFSLFKSDYVASMELMAGFLFFALVCIYLILSRKVKK